MLCEKCRNREANIKYVEVVNGVKTEHNLCAQCAREVDLGGHYTALFDGEYSIGRLLSGLLGFQTDMDEQEEEKKISQITCPTCGTAYSDFIKESRFGCPDCYGTFGLLMEEKMKALQGSTVHTGKVPVYYQDGYQEDQGAEEPMAKEDELSLLKSRLREAIQMEEYEEAAKYRDAIKELEERIEADV